jgi:hypothetical protein
VVVAGVWEQSAHGDRITLLATILIVVGFALVAFWIYARWGPSGSYRHRESRCHTALVPRRIAILLGAGASRGAGSVVPGPPPLGGQLFSALQDAYPDTWGSLDGELVKLFDEDFELGMAEFWEQNDTAVQRALVDMTCYFAAFKLESGDDAYSRLTRMLLHEGYLSVTGIATLNYDCLLELSAIGGGVPMRYTQDGSAASLVVWKPHGSCNFIPPVDWIGGGMKNVKYYYKGPLQILQPQEVLAHYAEGQTIPAAMSLYAPGKHSPVASEGIDQMRSEWDSWARSVSPVIVIGAAPNLADSHVWSPILGGSGEVWYVGGESRDFAEFQAGLGSRFVRIGDRFADALPTIERRLHLLA